MRTYRVRTVIIGVQEGQIHMSEYRLAIRPCHTALHTASVFVIVSKNQGQQ